MLEWPSLADAGAALPMPGDMTVVSKFPKKETV